jgi:hypothetical protein
MELQTSLVESEFIKWEEVCTSRGGEALQFYSEYQYYDPRADVMTPQCCYTWVVQADVLCVSSSNSVSFNKAELLKLARSNPLRDQENWTTAAGDIIHSCPDIVETFDQLE